MSEQPLTLPTVPNKQYKVESTTECAVYSVLGATEFLQGTAKPGSPLYFVAGTASIRLSSADYLLTGPFEGAPAGNGNGGGEQPASPEVIVLEDGSSVELADGRVYFAPPTAPNLSALSVAPNATVQIWLAYYGDDVVFPEDWVWSDTSEFQLPAGSAGGVGDFVVGEKYLITVHKNTLTGIDFTIAHRAITVKPATA